MLEVIVEYKVDDRPTTPEEFADEYLTEMLERASRPELSLPTPLIG